jgi:hypothetical protein
VMDSAISRVSSVVLTLFAVVFWVGAWYFITYDEREKHVRPS